MVAVCSHVSPRISQNINRTVSPQNIPELRAIVSCVTLSEGAREAAEIEPFLHRKSTFDRHEGWRFCCKQQTQMDVKLQSTISHLHSLSLGVAWPRLLESVFWAEGPCAKCILSVSALMTAESRTGVRSEVEMGPM